MKRLIKRTKRKPGSDSEEVSLRKRQMEQLEWYLTGQWTILNEALSELSAELEEEGGELEEVEENAVEHFERNKKRKR